MPDIVPQQAEGLLRNRATILSNLVVALLSLFVLQDSAPGMTLLWWVTGMAALAIARLFLSHWLRGSAWLSRRKLHVLTVGATLSGLSWGCLPIVLLPVGTVEDFAFAGFMIAGMTAGGITALCWYHPAYLGFLLGATLPLVACLLLQEEPVYLAMAAQVLFYAVMLVVISALYNRRLLQTLRLENELGQERRILEAIRHELAQAQSSKWRTLAQLSHHLRTPMNAVIGFSDMLRSEVLGPIGNPKHKEYINHIHDSGTRALQTITEILDVSQAEAGMLTLATTQVDVRETLAHCLQRHGATAAQRGVTLTATIASDLPRLPCDPARLQQILDQLLSNALRHTPSGGHVTLSASIDARWLAIRIADTGPGMAEDQLAEAMAPFVQFDDAMVRQDGGIGIGLPLARRLVELHGGEFTLLSAPDNGTTAIIRLPLSVSTGGIPA
ncbi:MAG: HAMP domain-containing histidine kinase [Alphaproteobacteria bacterium]|nr:HAMP domain-containing histidine kinase [Alphaproteobacteria bacterium]MBU0796386.1 HAMP domain-containing histidine kinase [Alphaproteobacteria bacterium]MBU0886737.1 HAMP domain-containing histidine kinase [Alphaproteobacteria bacterium]MBU1812650.1 HAMP domain-containing histidine kinase [Alphaproteobacteria bacterium]MBU2091652.1 HAMP domain-containing histidine kinase [Alphaproteobacteria bacterium]